MDNEITVITLGPDLFIVLQISYIYQSQWSTATAVLICTTRGPVWQFGSGLNWVLMPDHYLVLLPSHASPVPTWTHKVVVNIRLQVRATVDHLDSAVPVIKLGSVSVRDCVESQYGHVREAIYPQYGITEPVSIARGDFDTSSNTFHSWITILFGSTPEFDGLFCWIPTGVCFFFVSLTRKQQTEIKISPHWAKIPQ